MRVPNTAIKRPITEALTVDDVRVKLNNATVFSILDMNKRIISWSSNSPVDILQRSTVLVRDSDTPD